MISRAQLRRVPFGVTLAFALIIGFTVYAAVREEVVWRRAEQELRRTVKVRFSPAISPAARPAIEDWSDRAGDGIPEFLRLDSAEDRQAFRQWFAAIAEFQALRPLSEVPLEIGDCAALLRYAYRNALREHDQAWLTETKVVPEPAPPPIAKYRYPFTPVGAGLFRIKPGPFAPGDVHSGAFVEFADAETLKDLNTFLVSRDLRDAQPGDLLFYRQLEQNEPFHSMVYVGPSRWLDDGRGDWTSAIVVYHTGEPGPAGKGMRRVTLAELLNLPSPRWRPIEGNANFLGVYRWSILRGAD